MKRNWIYRALALALTALMLLSACAMAEQIDIAAPAVQAKDSDGSYTVKLNKKKVTRSAKVGDSISVDVGDYENVKWKSSDTAVAEVSDGEVDCIKKGKATISATFKKGGKSVTYKLVLKISGGSGGNEDSGGNEVRIVKSYNEDQDEATYFGKKEKWSVGLGDNGTMSAVVLPEEASQEVAWKSSDASVFKLGADGEYTALKPGKATVTAIAEGGAKQNLSVVVRKNACTVSFSKSKKKSLLKTAVANADAFLMVKSVEVKSTSKAEAVMILFNGTGKKIGKIKNASISISGGTLVYGGDDEEFGTDSLADGEEIASGTFDSVKVNCKAHSTKEFKVTFTGDQVVNPGLKLSASGFTLACDSDFTY